MDNEAAILTQNFGTLAIIVQSVAVLMGVCFTFAGFFELKKHAESRSMMSSHSATGPVLMIICGAIFLILPNFMGAIMLAFWGNYTGMGYDGGDSAYGALVPPILMLVRLIGVGSFMRGIVLLSRCGGQQAQPGTLGKAMIHIFAGVLCLHVMGTIDLLETILGMTNY